MSTAFKSIAVLAAVIGLALLAMPKGNTPRAAAPIAAAAAVPVPATIGDLVPAPMASDPADDVAHGIDVTGASFKQRGIEVELRIETASPVKLEDLDDGDRSLCVLLAKGRAGDPSARICLAGTEDTPQARFSTLDAGQRPVGSRLLAIGLTRPDSTTLVTTFRPGAIDLVRRSFSWQVAATTTAGACSTTDPCRDLAPNQPAEGQTRSLSAPRCFGANARPDRGSCINKALRLAVVPTPDDAQLQPNSYCRLRNRGGLLSPCVFGYESANPSATIALIGDSHAVHWRGALAQLANVKRWVGISVTFSGCRFSAEAPTQPDPQARRDCVSVRKRMYGWFKRHPEIHTVFIGNHIGGFGTEPGYSRAARGSARAIDRLPRTVKHVFVIRDVPHNSYRTIDCIAAAMRKGVPAGPACALPRSAALAPDPTVRGVQISKRKGVHVIDLTSRFCSARFCLPVIGGALVHKDIGHITDVYSNSLGPAFIHRYDQIVSGNR